LQNALRVPQFTPTRHQPHEIPSNNPSHSKVHYKKLKRVRQKSKIFFLFSLRQPSPSLSPSKTSRPKKPRKRSLITRSYAATSPPPTQALSGSPLPLLIQTSAEAHRQAGHLRHGAGGAAPHLRPPPPTPLPRGQARRRPRSRLLVLGAPAVAVLIPGARLLVAARRRRTIPGRGRAAALLRAVLPGRHATARAKAVRARRLYLALSCALW